MNSEKPFDPLERFAEIRATGFEDLLSLLTSFSLPPGVERLLVGNG